MSKQCIKCLTILEKDINWSSSKYKKRHYICNMCFNTAFKERRAYKQDRVTTRTNIVGNRRLALKVSNFIQSSIKRNKELNISRSTIAYIMQQPCYYCGYNDDLCGLDRVDSSVGYLLNNVVPCCSSCNFGKHIMTPEQYINHCKKVVSFQGVSLG